MLTLAAVAASKLIPIDRLEVTTSMDLSLATGSGTRTTFTNRIEIEGNLTERERAIPLNSARHCDVNKILRGEVSIEDQFITHE